MSQRLGRRDWVLVFLCALAWALPLRAQDAVGEVRLEVRDPSGAAMQASGTLRGLSTKVVAGFQTDAQGRFVFAMLPYGRYRLEVTSEGFATQAALIDVQSETPVVRTVTLALASQAYTVEVIGTTPLSGVDLSPREIAAPVQTATDAEIAESGALDLSDFLNQRLNGVYVNEMQGNPFQPDLNYRGYTASPLLGTPQGLSVYMDGVRLNQPFGDVVSWDLIPRVAIAEMTLVPGSNPLYGLNTLGGAISIQTKDGLTHRGEELELSGGSFGRGSVEFQHGGAARGFDWFLAGNLSFEDGWRTDSPSNVRQFFGKLGWQDSEDFDRADDGLREQFADRQRRAGATLSRPRLQRAYTPSRTTRGTKSPLVIVSARRALSSDVSVSGKGYYRYIRTTTFNGDINEDSLDQSVYQPSAAERAALTAAGYSGFPTSGATAANTPFPFWRCIGAGPAASMSPRRNATGCSTARMPARATTDSPGS